MGKIIVKFEFDTVVELLEQLGGSALARRIGLVRPAEDAAAPTNGPPSENPAPDLTPRKRTAFLRHPSGGVKATKNQAVIDEWIAQGAVYINRQEYEQAIATKAQKPTDPPAQPAAPEPSDEITEGEDDDADEDDTDSNVVDITPQPEITFEAVRDAVRQLNARKGLNVLLDTLAEFGVNKVSELSEVDYPAFMVRAQAVMNG